MITHCPHAACGGMLTRCALPVTIGSSLFFRQIWSPDPSRAQTQTVASQCVPGDLRRYQVTHCSIDLHSTVGKTVDLASGRMGHCRMLFLCSACEGWSRQSATIGHHAGTGRGFCQLNYDGMEPLAPMFALVSYRDTVRESSAPSL
jgi:hypothetical protein